MSKYQELDDLIVLCIKQGVNTFGALWQGRAGDKAYALGEDKYRAVDRRLQALRKAGRISWMGNRWSVVA